MKGDGIVAGEELRSQAVARTQTQIAMMKAGHLRSVHSPTDYRQNHLYTRAYLQLELDVLKALNNEK